MLGLLLGMVAIPAAAAPSAQTRFVTRATGIARSPAVRGSAQASHGQLAPSALGRRAANPAAKGAYRPVKRRARNRIKRRAATRLSVPGQSLLSSLGSSLEHRALRPIRSPTGRTAFRPLTAAVEVDSHQEQLLRAVARLAPGLAPPLKHQAHGRLAWQGTGIALSEAQDLYLLPNAFERLVRRLHLLHGAGLQHGEIKPENVVVTPYGELQLVGWSQLKKGGPPASDLEGLRRIRELLQQRFGVGG